MDLELKGKKALVTGSTAGIGFSTAQALAAEGAWVVVNGRTQKRVDSAIAEIRKAYPAVEVSGIAADVSNREGCAKVIQAVRTVDVLIRKRILQEYSPVLTPPAFREHGRSR
jgi:NAD(P)-dependent dehydrogenase (short-subunit alcohol dehydrogenase family)